MFNIYSLNKYIFFVQFPMLKNVFNQRIQFLRTLLIFAFAILQTSPIFLVFVMFHSSQVNKETISYLVSIRLHT